MSTGNVTNGGNERSINAKGVTPRQAKAQVSAWLGQPTVLKLSTVPTKMGQ